jgi:hypothetical protein
LAFGFLTGAYWLLAQDYTGNAGRAHKLVVVRFLSTPIQQCLSAKPLNSFTRLVVLRHL